jgi:AraC-like DNA-binding protein
VQFINRLRTTDVCFASGFNNVSNFNRQFLRHKGMTPSRSRVLLSDNFASGGVVVPDAMDGSAAPRRHAPGDSAGGGVPPGGWQGFA